MMNLDVLVIILRAISNFLLCISVKHFNKTSISALAAMKMVGCFRQCVVIFDLVSQILHADSFSNS